MCVTNSHTVPTFSDDASTTSERDHFKIDAFTHQPLLTASSVPIVSIDTSRFRGIRQVGLRGFQSYRTSAAVFQDALQLHLLPTNLF